MRVVQHLCGALAIVAISAQAQTSNSFRVTQLDAKTNGWHLTWPQAATDKAYTVQFQDTLADEIWRLPRSEIPFPLASTEWLDPATTNSSRFYRVVELPSATRGKLLSVIQSNTLSTLQLALIFSFGGIPVTPRYNVREYKIVYETITPLGAPTTASGALLLPENTGGPLPLVSYQHGTIVQTNDAPSSMNISGEVTLGVAFATTGYAAAVPDYLGLGDSPGFHSYHHARSEATACIDLLRAVKTLCATNGFPLSDRLFLCGYSQGGHATMALLRELEAYHTNEFTVTACAPMAGAYDLSGVTTTNFLSGNPQPNPYYFLYLLAAYQEVYHLAQTLADLLDSSSNYDKTLPPLLDGNTSGSQINRAMPLDPVQILKPEYLTAFRANPRHPLRLALEENDLFRWVPHAPMRLYHCAADQDVVIANSEVALASFHSLGATQVELIDPAPTQDHGGCVEPSLVQVKAWFDSLR
jgi:pimeloyl-ACP methyl ester carboxylesterase